MPLNTETTTNRLDFWAFKTFCLSTLFIIVFSIEAIKNWPPLIKQSSILFACLLPTGMVLFRQTPAWFDSKQVPKDVLWVLLVSALGLISSLLSKNPWVTLKSTALFIASGPFIFIISRYLFKITKNQKQFLWLASLILLFLCFFGIYEYVPYHRTSDGIHLFSGNPLPAGALLILLSAGPLTLLKQEYSPTQKTTLTICLLLSTIVVLLIAKKGPLLGLSIILLFLIYFINRSFLRFLVFFIFLTGVMLLFSDTLRSKYKTNLYNESSISLRTESYFFGFYVFKNNPFFGVGLKTDLARHLEDYDLRLADKISKNQYRTFVQSQKTFENIIMAFLVELGGLFTITYFGGLAYFVGGTLTRMKTKPQKEVAGMFIFSIIIGFTVISLTFDTLKFPNLNWLFHSLLGLMVNSVMIHPAKNSNEIPRD
jgi:O-antigen ligase